jgi:hypothetical protein
MVDAAGIELEPYCGRPSPPAKPCAGLTAVSELLYAEAAQSSGVFLKKTPPFIELKRAHEL